MKLPSVIELSRRRIALIQAVPESHIYKSAYPFGIVAEDMSMPKQEVRSEASLPNGSFGAEERRFRETIRAKNVALRKLFFAVTRGGIHFAALRATERAATEFSGTKAVSIRIAHPS
jgi:hypothetical protein